MPLIKCHFLILGTQRIHKYASCSNECFTLALIYVDRLIQRNNFLLTELNVHRVIITAVLLAAKFFDDAYYNNAYYAKVGGVHISEMNSLEVDFLFRINFSLHVTTELFEKYRMELLSHIQEPPHPFYQMNDDSLTKSLEYFARPLYNEAPNANTLNQQLSLEIGQEIYASSESGTAGINGFENIASENHFASEANNINASKMAYLHMPHFAPCANENTYFNAEDRAIVYPICHGGLTHHNHAVEHGFHNIQHYSDPMYTDSSNNQYFMNGTQMLTGCSRGP
jgi:Cyclin